MNTGSSGESYPSGDLTTNPTGSMNTFTARNVFDISRVQLLERIHSIKEHISKSNTEDEGIS